MNNYLYHGWVKKAKYCQLTGESEDGVLQRINNAKYSDWRIGGKIVKLLPNGYWVNYEEAQEWVNKEPPSYKVA